MLNNDLFFYDNHKNKYINKKLKILVAVSGGIDSMVMLNLLIKLGYNIAVAHANFNIRGIESNNDEFFVKNFCLKNNIIFHIKRFNTKNYAIINKISIQMAARELRYIWFEQLVNENNYNYISIAHHLDDSIETFFINLFRGTGIKGLLGIIPYRDNIIRPLLNISKIEILKYAIKNKIKWRDDISNTDNKYLRNYIRNKLLPLIKEISPIFLKSFKKTINNLYDDNIIINNTLDFIIKKITIEKKKNPIFWKIDFNKLKEFSPIKTIIFKIFYKYGFSNIEDIIKLFNSQSGKFLISNNFILLKDRNYLLLSYKNFFNKKIYTINNLNYIKSPIRLFFSLYSYIDHHATFAIDFHKIKFPLYIRTWRSGDYFYPIGINKKQKLSKYFKNEKMSIIDKQKYWILLNYDNNIISIIGKRLDNRFKVTHTTKKILNVFFLKK